MSCHDRDMWRAYPRIVYHITSNLYCQYISMYLYFPFDLIRQPRGRGVLIAAGVNIRQPLTQQGHIHGPDHGGQHQVLTSADRGEEQTVQQPW